VDHDPLGKRQGKKGKEFTASILNDFKELRTCFLNIFIILKWTAMYSFVLAFLSQKD
jgi:hypothetical protein